MNTNLEKSVERICAKYDGTLRLLAMGEEPTEEEKERILRESEEKWEKYQKEH